MPPCTCVVCFSLQQDEDFLAIRESRASVTLPTSHESAPYLERLASVVARWPLGAVQSEYAARADSPCREVLARELAARAASYGETP